MLHLLLDSRGTVGEAQKMTTLPRPTPLQHTERHGLPTFPIAWATTVKKELPTSSRQTDTGSLAPQVATRSQLLADHICGTCRCIRPENEWVPAHLQAWVRHSHRHLARCFFWAGFSSHTIPEADKQLRWTQNPCDMTKWLLCIPWWCHKTAPCPINTVEKTAAWVSSLQTHFLTPLQEPQTLWPVAGVEDPAIAAWMVYTTWTDRSAHHNSQKPVPKRLP